MSKRCHSDESEALSVFKAAFNDSGGYLTSWVNETDCCTMWLGISCNNQTNRVVSVEVGHYYIQDIQGICLWIGWFLAVCLTEPMLVYSSPIHCSENVFSLG
ncbi:DNA damage-repair/toleration protein DRT100-like isoform X2 [Cryptomeria japonica]|uniref:DNA damage-repair/toleration protein DRT100-like isoform X2 n=1 Tax=Cryptomeria japonica TaxID=3369 RepID=UPI0027D9E9F5|nr:DNA damage-repair/toleration protein DRT100-like isoform X2 [Cryptomeria japonica]